MQHLISVYNGIDCPDVWRPLLSGKRAGLVTNPSGVDRSLRLTSDLLHEAGVLCCLFSPEHGVRGDRQAGDHVATYTDERTGLPVYSLYGGSHHIPREVMNTLDAVVFDIQDVGARFYTYIYTLSYVMEDCAAADKEVIILDRLNPLGGAAPEGTVLQRAFSSFVGRYPIATRHNLTVGEFARYINDTEHIGCRLTVIPVRGWSRDVQFCDTDLSFIPPSPNIPTHASALCYIGTCLSEGTNLSEGRGTTRPFEMIGAPWLESERVVDHMRALALPGVRFRPCCFTPTFSKHASVMCRAVALHVTDPSVFRPFESALRLFDYIRRTHPDFALTPPDSRGIRFIDRLLGCDDFSREDFDPDVLLHRQAALLADYATAIRPYYLYD